MSIDLKCLRCHAGPEWIQGYPTKEADDFVKAIAAARDEALDSVTTMLWYDFRGIDAYDAIVEKVEAMRARKP